MDDPPAGRAGFGAPFSALDAALQNTLLPDTSSCPISLRAFVYELPRPRRVPSAALVAMWGFVGGCLLSSLAAALTSAAHWNLEGNPMIVCCGLLIFAMYAVILGGLAWSRGNLCTVSDGFKAAQGFALNYLTVAINFLVAFSMLESLVLIYKHRLRFLNGSLRWFLIRTALGLAAVPCVLIWGTHKTSGRDSIFQPGRYFCFTARFLRLGTLAWLVLSAVVMVSSGGFILYTAIRLGRTKKPPPSRPRVPLHFCVSLLCYTAFCVVWAVYALGQNGLMCARSLPPIYPQCLQAENQQRILDDLRANDAWQITLQRELRRPGTYLDFVDLLGCFLRLAVRELALTDWEAAVRVDDGGVVERRSVRSVALLVDTLMGIYRRSVAPARGAGDRPAARTARLDITIRRSSGQPPGSVLQVRNEQIDVLFAVVISRHLAGFSLPHFMTCLYGTLFFFLFGLLKRYRSAYLASVGAFRRKWAGPGRFSEAARRSGQ